MTKLKGEKLPQNYRIKTTTLEGIRWHKEVSNFMAERLRFKPIFDFLPKIQMSLPREKKILKSWEKYFEDRSVPYIVKCIPGKHGAFVTLWKECYVGFGEDKKPPPGPTD